MRKTIHQDEESTNLQQKCFLVGFVFAQDEMGVSLAPLTFGDVPTPLLLASGGADGGGGGEREVS